MRTILPIALLLLGASSAQGQSDTSEFAAASTVPAPSQVPTRSVPAAAPEPAPAPTRAQTSARAEAVTSAPGAQQEEPRKRSRVLWILVGAVAVLAIILAVR
jgi:hypothetical protein